MENAERVNKMYEARKNNEEYPLGHLDDGGARWYPSFEEKQPCCDKIRGPSRNYPNNYLNHCKTKKHIVYVVAQQVRIERLEEAVKKRDIENIKSVVEEEIKNSPYKKIDSAFSHPLHVAIEAMKASKMDAPDIIKCLLEKGADLDHTTDGVTFDHNGKKMHEPSGLHLAVSRNLPETVKVLLEHGADTRLTVKKNSERFAAIDLAAEVGYDHIVSILANYDKESINSTKASNINRRRVYPLLAAKRNNQKSTQDLLLKLGADPNLKGPGNQRAADL